MPIPGNELICIFDADQVARKEFFLRMVPLFDAGDDVAMVLSPQCFHNLNYHTDIFNHSNLQFWCGGAGLQPAFCLSQVCSTCWHACTC